MFNTESREEAIVQCQVWVDVWTSLESRYGTLPA